jgi:hypothetical protein
VPAARAKVITETTAAALTGDCVAASRRWSAAVLLAWCLLAVGDSAHAGYYSTFGLSCIGAGFLILLAVVAARAPLVVPDRTLLLVPAIVCFVEAIVNPTKGFLYLRGDDLHAIEALGIATTVMFALSLLARGRWQRAAWFGLVGLAAATGIVTIVVINDPGIDVWDILQQSSSGLLHGHDMYRQHWAHSTGLQTVYPYLPGSTLLLAPFRWLLGDVRYGLLLASLLGAWLIRRIESAEAPAVAGLLLVVPGWVLLVNRSWTEPLLVAALAGTILALRSGRTTLAVVALAIALASKQHIALLLPLFAFWPSFGLRRTATSCGLALLVVLPWLIAGPHALWHDAVDANLGLGAQTKALNAQALLLRHGVSVGGWFLAVALVGAYALVLWRVPRTPSGLALGSALVIWTFDLANTQTYFNHYILPIGLLLVALAAAETPSPRSKSPASVSVGG